MLTNPVVNRIASSSTSTSTSTSSSSSSSSSTSNAQLCARPRSRPRSFQRTKSISESPSTAAQKISDYLSSPSCTLTQTSHDLHALQNALTHLILSPKLEAERTVASHVASVLRSSRADPTLRYRFTNLTESLSQWLRTDHDVALSLLTLLLRPTVRSRHARDAATQCTVLRAAVTCLSSISTPGNNSSSSKRNNHHSPQISASNLRHSADVKRHVPNILPLLHDILFPVRSSLNSNSTTNNTTAAESSAATSGAGSDASIATGSVRGSPCTGQGQSYMHASTRRRLALSVLQALAMVAPDACFPFWPQFLPLKAGVTPSAAPKVQTIATLLLFDADVDVRFAATSVASTMVSSARPLMQRRLRTTSTYPSTVASSSFSHSSSVSATNSYSPNSSNSSTLSFIPLSERVLAACVALANIAASALHRENAPTVLPKLARLASDIVATVPPPAMPPQALKELASRLLAVASDVTANQTVRAAAASALAATLESVHQSVAASPSSNQTRRLVDRTSTSHIIQQSHQLLFEQIRDTIVSDIVSQNDPSYPIEEMLSVLRVVVSTNPLLFVPAFPSLDPFFTAAVDHSDLSCRSSTNTNKSTFALHVIRVVETFVSSLARLHSTGKVEHEETLTHVVCQVYRNVLHSAVHHPFHAVRIQAVIAFDALLRFFPYDSLSKGTSSSPIALATANEETGSDFVCSSAEGVGFQMTPRDVMLECVYELSKILSTESDHSKTSPNVRAAAAKALGGLNVKRIDCETILSTLSCLLSVARRCDREREVGIIGRALSSFTNIVDGVIESSNYNLLKATGDEIFDAAVFARELVLYWEVPQRRDKLSSAVRAQTEMSLAAALQTVSMFLCVACLTGFTDDNIRGNREKFGRMAEMTSSAVEILCELARNEDELVNLRCGCCKAIGRVLCQLTASPVKIETEENTVQLTDEIVMRLLQALQSNIGQLRTGRVEAAAAKALTDVLSSSAPSLTSGSQSTAFKAADESGPSIDSIVACETTIVGPHELVRCGRSLAWGTRQLRALDLGSKDRGAFVHLQNCVSELVCKALQHPSTTNIGHSPEAKVDTDAEVVSMLVFGICTFHGVSKYVTDALMKVTRVADVKRIMMAEKISIHVVADEVQEALRRLFDLVEVASMTA